MKTAELEGPLLDYWVARALRLEPIKGQSRGFFYWEDEEGDHSGWFAPSRSWEHGGPIIDQKRLSFATIGTGPADKSGNEPVVAISSFGRRAMSGPTHLIAAMRAVVSDEYGDTVEEEKCT